MREFGVGQVVVEKPTGGRGEGGRDLALVDRHLQAN